MRAMEFLGMISAIALPLFNIPLILRICRRQSSDDISLVWVVGVWICIVGMTPAGLASADRIWRVYSVINILFFTGVLIAVLWYHPRFQKKQPLKLE